MGDDRNNILVEHHPPPMGWRVVGAISQKEPLWHYLSEAPPTVGAKGPGNFLPIMPPRLLEMDFQAVTTKNADSAQQRSFKEIYSGGHFSKWTNIVTLPKLCATNGWRVATEKYFTKNTSQIDGNQAITTKDS